MSRLIGSRYLSTIQSQQKIQKHIKELSSLISLSAKKFPYLVYVQKAQINIKSFDDIVAEQKELKVAHKEVKKNKKHLTYWDAINFDNNYDDETTALLLSVVTLQKSDLQIFYNALNEKQEWLYMRGTDIPTKFTAAGRDLINNWVNRTKYNFMPLANAVLTHLTVSPYNKMLIMIDNKKDKLKNNYNENYSKLLTNMIYVRLDSDFEKKISRLNKTDTERELLLLAQSYKHHEDYSFLRKSFSEKAVKMMDNAVKKYPETIKWFMDGSNKINSIPRKISDHHGVGSCGHTRETMDWTVNQLHTIYKHGWEHYVTKKLVHYGLGWNVLTASDVKLYDCPELETYIEKRKN